ncbi:MULTISPECIES: hypothetical protein [unclassified Virgibacillus]|uniref:hypothetical protein n=1 Tax=unclassified Virgibacillus TaxID=2620237 RepID=UPI0024DE8CA4|nr:hypothetical protein [Virgibacillus sp. LDC-1]
MEQCTPEPKSPSIFGKLGSWAKKATKKAATGLQQVGAGLVVGAKVAGKIGMKSAKFLVFDDVNTLFSKDASFLDRTIAAVSLVPVPIGKVLKVAKLGKLGFSANSAGKATRGSGAASNVSKGTGKYQVGAYKDIKGVEGLDAHHAGQKAATKKLVDNYDLNTAPAINVPKVGHTIKGPNGIVSRSTKGIDNPRQLLARDIRELRRVYDDIPNSALKELIELNKKMYPEMRK